MSTHNSTILPSGNNYYWTVHYGYYWMIIPCYSPLTMRKASKALFGPSKSGRALGGDAGPGDLPLDSLAESRKSHRRCPIIPRHHHIAPGGVRQQIFALGTCVNRLDLFSRESGAERFLLELPGVRVNRVHSLDPFSLRSKSAVQGTSERGIR
jgi:hypothetical protein